ncbi:MAG: calcium/sodium antiporter [Bryobacteraceae bacterium]|nr:calcium/sodium antiporter [Bryobacteraceae bacterium]MDW8377049.1 calcium/sodium antiporter [Bryobacterales bacterium]
MDVILQTPVLAAGLFLVGLVLLLTGAKLFVDAIAALAQALGVSPLIVGMTVVAFGTSAPELIINALSAYRGETGLAFGNIVGASTVNLGLVLALTAMIQPLKVEPSLITREIPMVWVAVCAFLILGNDRRLAAASQDVFSRGDGLILLLLFAIFLYYTAIYSVAKRALTGRAEAGFMEQVESQHRVPPSRSIPRYLIKVLLGLVGVSLGADWTVEGAVRLARLLGLGENIIGLTLVSLGTTLPELATCVMAARRGNADIALGNVVGSNLFNILAIGGIVSSIRPVALPPGGHADLLFLAAMSVVLLPVAIRSGQTVTRGEGAFLLATYLLFLVWRVSSV